MKRKLKLRRESIRVLATVGLADLTDVIGGYKAETDGCTTTRTAPSPSASPDACPWPPPLR